MKKAIRIILATTFTLLMITGGSLTTTARAHAAASCSIGDFCVYEHPEFKGKWFGTRRARFAWNCIAHDSFCGTTRKLNDRDSSWRNAWEHRSVRVYEHPHYKGKSFCIPANRALAKYKHNAAAFQDRGSAHKNTSGTTKC